jgi:hypothetical protein
MTRRVFVVILIALCSAAALAAPQRWALISTDAVSKTALPDLLTAELSRAADIQLVERDQLAAALKEQEVATLLGAEGKERLALGKLLKADVLAILSTETQGEKTVLTVCLADTKTGARLAFQRLPFAASDVMKATGEISALINQMRSRFAGGLKMLVGVPHFLSKDLSHDNDHLQAAFAALLENALYRSPGVAVLEIEEAQWVRRELEIAGERVVARPAVLFVECEYETEREVAAAGGFRVRLRGTITDGRQTIQRFAPGTQPLEGMVKWLGTDLASAVLAAGKQQFVPADTPAQFRVLTSRADAFAKVGSWEHSLGLREAALLLDGGSIEQRRRVVIELGQQIEQAHNRLHIRFDAIRSANFKFGQLDVDPAAIDANFRAEVDAQWAAIVPKWSRCIDQVEYVARSGKVNFTQAHELVRLVLSVQLPLFQSLATRPMAYAPLAARRQRFVAEVGPVLMALPTEPGPKAAEAARAAWRESEWTASLAYLPSRENIRFLAKLVHEFPADISVPPPNALMSQMTACASPYAHEFMVKATDECDYPALLDLLIKSEKPSLVIVARIARVWMQDNIENRQRPRRVITAEMEPIYREAEQIGIANPNWERVLSKIDFMNGYTNLNLLPAHTIVLGESSPQRPPGESVASEGPVSYDEVPFQVRMPDGTLLPKAQWQALQKFSTPAFHLSMCPGGADFDVAWDHKAVFLHRRLGVLDPVFVSPNEETIDVAWDGRRVWIATGTQGILVLDAAGKTVAKIGPQQGLPPADRAALIRVLPDGRMFATGSFGEEYRGWCAMITPAGAGDAEPPAYAVNVFHKATHTMDPEVQRTWNRPLMMKAAGDPALVFKPAWAIIAPPGSQTPAGVAWVGRGGHTGYNVGASEWLRVDLKTLAVSVYTPVNHASTGIFRFVNRDDALAGGFPFIRIRPDRPFDDGRSWRYLCDIDDGISRPVEYDGRLYLPGPQWFSLNPANFEVRRVGPGIKVDGRLESDLSYAPSHVCGLIGWSDDRAYPISLDPKKPLRIRATPRVGARFDVSSRPGPVQRFELGLIRKCNESDIEFESGHGLLRAFRSNSPWQFEGRMLFKQADPRRVDEETRNALLARIRRVLSFAEERQRIGITEEQADRLNALVNPPAPKLTPVPGQPLRYVKPQTRIDPEKFSKLYEAWERADPASLSKARDTLLKAVSDMGEDLIARSQKTDADIRSTLSPQQMKSINFESANP